MYRGQYQAILTEQACLIRDLFSELYLVRYGIYGLFSCETRAADRPSFPIV